MLSLAMSPIARHDRSRQRLLTFPIVKALRLISKARRANLASSCCAFSTKLLHSANKFVELSTCLTESMRFSLKSNLAEVGMAVGLERRSSDFNFL
jgi:hypothetical protein